MLVTRRTQNWLPEVFNNFFDTEFLPKVNTMSPAINVIERDTEYAVQLAAPGMTKDDFKVNLDEEQNLVIAMEKKQEAEENKPEERYIRKEFSFTSFQQKYVLPEDVDIEKITAAVNNGILCITLPKKTEEEMKKETKLIEIN